MAKEEKMKIMEKIAFFLDKNKKVLSIIFLSLLVVLILLGVASEINKTRNIKATVEAESAEDIFQKWTSEADEEVKTKLETELLDKIALIQKKYKATYAIRRAYLIEANYLFEKKEWEKSEAIYIKIAEKYSKTSFAPLSLMKAAVSAENNKNIDQAINYYNLLIEKYRTNSVEIPRAIFNLGRLYESKKNTEEALKAYKILEDDFSTSNWTKLAIDRIIYLSK